MHPLAFHLSRFANGQRPILTGPGEFWCARRYRAVLLSVSLALSSVLAGAHQTQMMGPQAMRSPEKLGGELAFVTRVRPLDLRSFRAAPVVSLPSERHRQNPTDRDVFWRLVCRNTDDDLLLRDR